MQIFFALNRSNSLPIAVFCNSLTLASSTCYISYIHLPRIKIAVYIGLEVLWRAAE